MLGLGVGVGAAGLGAWRHVHRPRPRPRAELGHLANTELNVLFVVTDQERSWDQLPKGFIEAHCPARASLLERSVSIDGAHTPIQLCSMARGAIHSGAHAPNNGLWENIPVPMAGDLSTELPTLASMLQDAGFHTGYAGKWHLSKFEGEGSAAASELGAKIRSYGFDETECRAELDGANAGLDNDAETIAASLRFIANQRGADKPWFLAVNLVNPHDVMYYTSGEAMTRTRASEFPSPSVRPPDTPLYQRDLGYALVGPWGSSTLASRPPAVREYFEVWNELLGRMDDSRPEHAREFQNFYWNCIRDSDRHLATLLAGLDALGEAERTIIAFCSDHGEYLGAHGLRAKGVSAYREGSHIPLLIHHPDGLQGVRAPNLASLVDLAPTILGLVGIDRATLAEHYPSLVGHDLSELVWDPAARTPRDEAGILTYWTGLAYLDRRAPRLAAAAMAKTGLAHKAALLDMLRQLDWDKRGHMRGLYDGRWKFSRYFSPDDHHLPADLDTLAARNDVELYDTAVDPEERDNLASVAIHRDTLARLNDQTNALIRAEIGDDSGDFLPLFAR